MITKTPAFLDLNLLSIFLEVYRLGSITLAADALEMTQPGVSGALKRLRQQLGAELFVREGRGITPTHIAVRLASQISPALDNVSNAISCIQRFDPQQPSTFSVFCNEMALLHFHPQVERDTTMGNIGIEFVITPSREEKVLEALSMQKADLVLDVESYHSLSYKSCPILQDTLVIIARKCHPRIDRVLTEQQFYREKHVTIRLRKSNMHLADYFGKKPLKAREISAECGSLMSMLALVSGSDSIGSTSRSLAIRYAAMFNLQIIEPPFATLPIEHMMIWHSRTDYSPAHQWLREKIRSFDGRL